MNDRLHEIQTEIKTIESMIDSLSAPMLELVLEEQRNLQFELEALKRNIAKAGNHQMTEEHFNESSFS